MTADAIGAALVKFGPTGLVIVILSVMLFALGGAFLAFVKWVVENTVSKKVYDTLVESIDKKIDRNFEAVLRS